MSAKRTPYKFCAAGVYSDGPVAAWGWGKAFDVMNDDADHLSPPNPNAPLNAGVIPGSQEQGPFFQSTEWFTFGLTSALTDPD